MGYLADVGVYVEKVALQQALRPIQIPKKGKGFSESFFITCTVFVF